MPRLVQDTCAVLRVEEKKSELHASVQGPRMEEGRAEALPRVEARQREETVLIG